MSQSEKIDVVDQSFNGLNDRDLTSVRFAADITFEGPLMPRLSLSELFVAVFQNYLS